MGNFYVKGNRKRIVQKFFFYNNKQLNCISSLTVCKIFFLAPSSRTFRKNSAEENGTGDSKAFSFTSKTQKFFGVSLSHL